MRAELQSDAFARVSQGVRKRAVAPVSGLRWAQTSRALRITVRRLQYWRDRGYLGVGAQALFGDCDINAALSALVLDRLQSPHSVAKSSACLDVFRAQLDDVRSSHVPELLSPYAFLRYTRAHIRSNNQPAYLLDAVVWPIESAHLSDYLLASAESPASAFLVVDLSRALDAFGLASNLRPL